MNREKVIITGAAGLVGQNLVPRLKQLGWSNIVAIDKHVENGRIFRRLHPDIHYVEADLSQPGSWQHEFVDCRRLVSCHAQIGGLHWAEFEANNLVATQRMLDAATRNAVPYVVSISSSVVNSMAKDFYTESKKLQETEIAKSGIRQVVLRPTLMFGWFDRKHVGWLARFMQRTPVFPIPGNGNYLRQPLYAGDFSDIIASALSHEPEGAYNISGQERINYIDLIRAVKQATSAKARIVKIPYSIFWAMLRVNALWDKNPAFTTAQLEALVTPDVFEVIDWPRIFGVRSTPLEEALAHTYQHPEYSKIVLSF